MAEADGLLSAKIDIHASHHWANSSSVMGPDRTPYSNGVLLLARLSLTGSSCSAFHLTSRRVMLGLRGHRMAYSVLVAADTRYS
jgi:hypothetical protein